MHLQIHQKPFTPISFNGDIFSQDMLKLLKIKAMSKRDYGFKLDINFDCEAEVLELIKKAFLSGLITVNEEDDDTFFIHEKIAQFSRKLIETFDDHRGVVGVKVVRGKLAVGLSMDKGSWGIEQRDIWEEPQKFSPDFLSWVVLFNTVCNSNIFFSPISVGGLDIVLNEFETDVLDLLDLDFDDIDDTLERDIAETFSVMYLCEVFNIHYDEDNIEMMLYTLIDLVDEYHKLNGDLIKSDDWILVEFNLLKRVSLIGLSKDELHLVNKIKEFIQFLISNQKKMVDAFYSTTDCEESFDMYNQQITLGYVVLNDNHASIINRDYVESMESMDVEGFILDIDEDFNEKLSLLNQFDDALFSVVKAFDVVWSP